VFTMLHYTNGYALCSSYLLCTATSNLVSKKVPELPDSETACSYVQLSQLVQNCRILHTNCASPFTGCKFMHDLYINETYRSRRKVLSLTIFIHLYTHQTHEKRQGKVVHYGRSWSSKLLLTGSTYMISY